MFGSLFSFISFWNNELASAYGLLCVKLIRLSSPVYLILKIYRNCKKIKWKKLCTFDLKKLVILHRHIYFIYLVRFLLLFSAESELLLTKTCHTWETVSKYFTLKIRLIGWNSGSYLLDVIYTCRMAYVQGCTT